jgi:hypothetical protein
MNAFMTEVNMHINDKYKTKVWLLLDNLMLRLNNDLNNAKGVNWIFDEESIIMAT